jgi:hypothetical protein
LYLLNRGDYSLKKAASRKMKTINVRSHENGERKENIHEIRKRIENILSEREQKKLWDL